MAQFKVTAPDGTPYMVTAPDGASQDQIMAYVQQQHAANTAPQQAPTPQAEPLTQYAKDNFSAPPPTAPAAPGMMEELGTGLGVGAGQVVGNIDRASAGALKKIGIDTGGQKRYEQFQQHNQRPDVAAELSSTPGEIGKIAGEIGMTAPLALATENPLVLGAGSGALTTESNTLGGAALDTGIGMAGGKLGDKLIKGITKTPQLSNDVKMLLDEGVKPTIGQLSGGVGRTLENASTSLPFARDAVIGAKNRALESFNRAAINRALDPIGAALPDHVSVGHEGVAYAGDKLSGAYDDLLPNLKAIPDTTYMQGMNAIATKAANVLPADKAAQFTRILDGVTKPLAPLGTGFTAGAKPAPAFVLGDAVKDIDSQLASYGRQFSKSSDPDHQAMGDGFTAARDELQQLLMRSNPENAANLKAINTGYANLVRVEKAASSNGARNGVFTPAQLKNAVKQADTSVRKRAIARGTGLMQDLATAGQNVMGETIPDSGTPLRTIVTDPLKTVASLPATVGAKLLYSRPGQAGARWLATGARPQALQQLGTGIAPVGGILGSQGAIGAGDEAGSLLYGPPQ